MILHLFLGTALLPFPAANAPFLAAPSPAEVQEPATELEWYAGSLEDALAAVLDRPSWAVIHFWAEWSEWSRLQKEQTLEDSAVAAAFDGMLLLDVEASSPRFAALNERFKPRTFPTLVFVRFDGKADEVIEGYLPAAELVKEVARVRAGNSTLSDLEARVAAAPGDLEARFALGNKKWDLGDDEGYFAELEAIRLADPESRSLTRRRIDLRELQDRVFGSRREGKELRLEPLLLFLREETYPELLWEGWKNLAALYESAELQAYAEAREAHRKAWSYVPAKEKTGYGIELAWAYSNHSDKAITLEEKRFALRIAKESVDAAALADEASLHSQGLYVLAHCYAMNGDTAAAESTLRAAAVRYPKDDFHREALRALVEGEG